jgi:hypothetical protein
MNNLLKACPYLSNNNHDDDDDDDDVALCLSKKISSVGSDWILLHFGGFCADNSFHYQFIISWDDDDEFMWKHMPRVIFEIYGNHLWGGGRDERP